MIPGLENAEFVRYGQMHRNTFINSPLLLKPSLQFAGREDLLFCGQITGIEGYAGNIASGLLAGWNMVRILEGETPVVLPKETMLGALCHYITHADPAGFQPMKANFGILPVIDDEKVKGKRARGKVFADRAEQALFTFIESNSLQALITPTNILD
jgi:methylenetetrahydrofolate--tRNA-(uracil-5-)-methyltransferase